MGINHQGPIVTDGLVLCLDAANPKSYPGSGTAWMDLSGNGNNGTLTNGPTYNSGNKGSIVFDGVNDYVRTNYQLQQLTFNQFSVSSWCNSSNFGKNYMGIVSDAAYRHRFELRMSGSTFSPQILFGNNDTPNNATSSEQLLNNNWYNISATFDNSLGTENIKLFVNGVLKSAGNYTGTIALLSGKIDVGIIQNSTSFAFVGKIPQV